MTIVTEARSAEPSAGGRADPSGIPVDHRGSPIPTFGMIASRFKEFRKRRGLMAALVIVTVGIPVIFLGIRLILHAAAPTTYGPAGGFSVYAGLSAGVLYVFGFIMAATLGATAGSIDLTEGMFRHLVVTGRSRLALYLARIPAGFAIIGSLIAIGFTVVCVVCVYAAPTQLAYNGVSVPIGLSRTGLESWAAAHPDEVICNFPVRGDEASSTFSPSSPVGQTILNTPCGNGPGGPGGPPRFVKHAAGPPGLAPAPPTAALSARAAIAIADLDYPAYSELFLAPSTSLMVKTGLWLELEAAIGFLVGLGLGSLIGQRTVAVIMMIVLEVVVTPILSRARLPHLSNLQRADVGLATAHLEPGGLGIMGGGGGGPGGGGGSPMLLPESTRVAVLVVIAWAVGWSVLGAWRMMTRDA